MTITGHGDQTLEELFPEYADIMRDEYKSVTILDLLGHRSEFVNKLIPGLDGQGLGNGVIPQSQGMEMLEWVAWEAHENTPFRRPSGGGHGSLEDWENYCRNDGGGEWNIKFYYC